MGFRALRVLRGFRGFSRLGFRRRTVALSPLEIAVRGGGAALSRFKLIRVHRQTHRAMIRGKGFRVCLAYGMFQGFRALRGSMFRV